MRSRWALVLLIACAFLQSAGAADHNQRNVILLVTDGLRWQEVFRGADPSLLDKDHGGVDDPDAIKREFMRPTANERRRVLLPFLWTVVAMHGQIFGNRDRGSIARVTNGMKFSYPGYNEMFSGHPDPRIDSNEAGPNPNPTVFEVLNRLSAFHARVAAFATWAEFHDIFNQRRSGLPVCAGWDTPTAGTTESERLLNTLSRSITHVWSDSTFDAFTNTAALDYVQTRKPRVLFIGDGETDEWGHEGRYDLLLESAHNFDGFLQQLWTALQNMPQYRDNTTLLITTDHGRGDGPTEWKNHGRDVDGAEYIWIAAIGPDVGALGEIGAGAAVTQSQIAATLAAAVGEDYRRTVQQAAPPIQFTRH